MQENMPKVRNYNIKEHNNNDHDEDDTEREIVNLQKDIRNRQKRFETQEELNRRGIIVQDDRIMSDDDNEDNNFSMPRKTKTAVGSNSNLRRKQNEGAKITKKTSSKKIGNEIIL